MRWLNTGLWALLALTVVASIGLLLFVDALGAGVTAVSLLLTVGLIWLILPRRYEIWPDRLRIVFLLGGWDIPLDGIESVHPGRWYQAYGFMGVRFATAPGQTVTILRRNSNLFTRPNVVISPEDRDGFLRELTRVMERRQRIGSG
jgi:hypothetical protein